MKRMAIFFVIQNVFKKEKRLMCSVDGAPILYFFLIFQQTQYT